MAILNKVRVQLLDESTGAVLQEVDVLTSADAVTFSDGETFQEKLDAGLLKGAKGDTGATGSQGATGATGATGTAGIRGSQWFTGTLVTGTSTTATIFSGSGITSALVGDQYLNTSTGNVYNCTVAGNAATAKWVYSICLKGATGAAGAQGIQGPAGADGASVKYGTDYTSGTQVKLFLKTM
ncbi:Collagen triple helix repeat-containing protein [Clostridium sp. DL-VIII]|uniref:hypothetical protein n=1 Tax=Clostridium sp. DL-VIII TaxID=641107 RepID=UPI00023B05A0|nr:hypothetical protein [Clostridium sp. DL-VIII]EHJ00867.1 Collagen triple helix repeat-containing protein [Clostridium sp. DL-VIII]